MESFCRKENISLLIDAAHPFAEELHRNVNDVSDKLQIPAILYDRIYPRIEKHDGIVWCDSFEDAVQKIKKEEVYILLALTGVKSIGKLKALWQEAAAAISVSSTVRVHANWREARHSPKNICVTTMPEKTNAC